MKKLLLLGLISSQLNAADLIFKHGFEHTASVVGTATGIVATGLSLKLDVNGTVETLFIDADGEFVFNLDVAIGDSWSVTVETLPTNPQQLSCTLLNFTGVMPTGGSDVLQVNCDDIVWNWDLMNWDDGGWN